MNKLQLLKASIPILLILLIAVLSLALLYQSQLLTIVALLVFTAVAGLLTYYYVLKQN